MHPHLAGLPTPPSLSKLIKEGASLTGNLIKYDIPASKCADKAKIWWDVVIRNCHCTCTWPPCPSSFSLLPLYQLSMNIYTIFQGHLWVLLDEKYYMLQFSRLVSHLIWCSSHQISFLNWISFAFLDSRLYELQCLNHVCMLHKPKGWSGAHDHTYKTDISKQKLELICYALKT